MEKMVFNRRQFLQFSAASTAVLLAACAPQPAAPKEAPQPVDQEEPEAPGAAAEPAAEATTAPAEAPAEQLELTLLMVDWGDDARVAIDEVIVPKFQEQNPGLTVMVDYTGWGELDAKVMTSAAGGVQPDLFQADLIEFGIKYYMKGLIAELDPLVESTPGVADALTDFYEKSIAEASTWKGKLLAMPYLLDNRCLVYRKDFFEEVGLDPDKEFADWEEFRAAANALTIRDGDSYQRMGWWGNTGQFCFQVYVQFLWQNDGAVLNEDNTAPAFNSDAGVEALEFWTKLLREDKVAPVEGMQAEGDMSLMTSGAQAMGFDNYWQLINVQKYAPELWDAQGVQILGNKKKAGLWYANCFMISSNPRKEGAWKLLQSFVLDDDNFKAYLEAMGALPPRKSLVPACKHITPLHQIMIDGVMDAENSHTSPAVPFAVMELFERIDEACQRALYGEATPKEALAQAEQECIQIFERHANE